MSEGEHTADFGSPDHIKHLIGPPLWEMFINVYWRPRKGFADGYDVADEYPHETRAVAEEEARIMDDHAMQYQYTIRVSKQEGGRPVPEIITFAMPDKTDWICEKADAEIKEARSMAAE